MGLETQPVLFHVLTPLHAGVGQAAELIDLPIARMAGTDIPYLPGSSIKGVLREAHGGNRNATDRELAIFGPDKDNASQHAGALIVGDARLLAMPVRSAAGTFALCTAPLLLQLALRDWEALRPLVTGLDVKDKALPASDLCIYPGNRTLILEDLDIPAEQTEGAAAMLGELLEKSLKAPWLAGRVVILPDRVMTHLFKHATQVDARNALDPESRTVRKGALWLEESLPAETILVAQLAAEDSRRVVDKQRIEISAQQILDNVLPTDGRVLQFGGKISVGRGRCVMRRAEQTAPAVKPPKALPAQQAPTTQVAAAMQGQGGGAGGAGGGGGGVQQRTQTQPGGGGGGGGGGQRPQGQGGARTAGNRGGNR